MTNKKFMIAVGISDRNNDWVWQGLAVAGSNKEAKQITRKWAESLGFSFNLKHSIESVADGLTKEEIADDPLCMEVNNKVKTGVYDSSNFSKIGKPLKHKQSFNPLF